MRKFMTVLATTGLVAGSAIAGASFSADFATAHVFRGQTVVDELVVQPGVELDGFGMPEEYGNIALGIWGTTAPFNDDTPSYDSIYETDWYINYTLPQFVERLDFYLGYTQYQYSFSADEKELNLGTSYLLGGFELGGSMNFMLDNRNLLTEDQTYIDLYADYEFDVSEDFELSAGALMGLMFQGKGNSAAGLDDGLNQYEIYADAAYALGDMWGLGASLTYIGQFSSDVLPDRVGPVAGYDKGLVLMFSIGCEM